MIKLRVKFGVQFLRRSMKNKFTQFQVWNILRNKIFDNVYKEVHKKANYKVKYNIYGQITDKIKNQIVNIALETMHNTP